MDEACRISLVSIGALLLMMSHALGSDSVDLNFSIEDIKEKIEELPKDSEEYTSISNCLDIIEKLINEINKEKEKGEEADAKTITSLQDKLEEQKAEIQRILKELQEHKERKQSENNVILFSRATSISEMEHINCPARKKNFLKNQPIEMIETEEDHEHEKLEE
jgi:translation initiation factor 2B subunit (eIF-2B alpha/beta/delta family)